MRQFSVSGAGFGARARGDSISADPRFVQNLHSSKSTCKPFPQPCRDLCIPPTAEQDWW